MLSGILAVLAMTLVFRLAQLQPDRRGLGTHEQMGLPSCGFYERTGWPCPTCGITTAMSYLYKGQIVMSFYTQPAGAILALGLFAVILLLIDSTLTGATWPEILATLINRYAIIAGLSVILLGWLWCCVVAREGT